MNRDDVIRMAREADKFANKSAAPSGSEWWQLERDTHLAALVAAHVRETEFKPDWNNYRQGVADGAAAERAEMAKHCVEITRVAVTKAVDGAIALEREACAKVCEDWIAWDLDDPGSTAAAAIRARGETK